MFDRMEYVFGASAAAALYRRSMIDDVSVDGAFSIPTSSPTARMPMWPGARSCWAGAASTRRPRPAGTCAPWLPGNRRTISPAINMHSVKNRFLMRIKNATPGLYRRCWLPMTMRDLVVVGGCLLAEPRSLPAFWRLAACWRNAWAQRREIMRRKRVDDQALMRWFRFEPSAEPLVPELAAEATAGVLASDAA